MHHYTLTPKRRHLRDKESREQAKLGGKSDKFLEQAKQQSDKLLEQAKQQSD